jgi:LysR family transcriptional regulator, glycine cleavage system transcriptional activator
MQRSLLPPLRALQVFEAVGRTGSNSSAALELNVSPGAITQQMAILESYVGAPLFMRDGRGLALTTVAKKYFEQIEKGFDQLRKAQTEFNVQVSNENISVSCLPSMLHRWLNPLIADFLKDDRATGIRLFSDLREPEEPLDRNVFRLTYGIAAAGYSYKRPLFADICTPMCSPNFLKNHPQAASPEGLRQVGLIEIDWRLRLAEVPHWSDWFDGLGVERPSQPPVAVFSLSSLALEAAADGMGVTLGQETLAAPDLRANRLVRLSDRSIVMPATYYLCWGEETMKSAKSRDFLDWILQRAAVRSAEIENHATNYKKSSEMC